MRHSPGNPSARERIVQVPILEIARPPGELHHMAFGDHDPAGLSREADRHVLEVQQFTRNAVPCACLG